MRASLPPWTAFGRQELVSAVKLRRAGCQILPGKGSWLPGRDACFPRGKSSSPWSFLWADARAPHATNQPSLTPFLGGTLPMAGRGTPWLCLPQSGAARCKVPWYRSSQTQNVLRFPC